MQSRISSRLIRNLLLPLAALATLGNAASAQTPPNGVLGQRFVAAHADLVDFENLTDYGCSTGVGLKLPVRTEVDLGLGLAYGWLNTGGRSIRERSISSSVTWHASSGLVRPFATASVGYDWMRDYFSWTRRSDTAGRWGAAVGFEVPVRGVTITPSVGYSDWFESKWVGATFYGIEASYWFTGTVGGYAGVVHHDYDGDNGSSSVYRLGVRLKF